MIEYTVRVYTNGTKRWYLNDQLHREDGPAVEYANGDKFWHLNDKLHREDGPACEWANGSKSWYLNGKSMTEQEHQKRMNPVNERKFKIGDKVTAGDQYDGAWQNLVVKSYHSDGSIMVYNLDMESNGLIPEQHLELIKAKELTVAELSALLGYEVKIIKG